MRPENLSKEPNPIPIKNFTVVVEVVVIWLKNTHQLEVSNSFESPRLQTDLSHGCLSMARAVRGCQLEICVMSHRHGPRCFAPLVGRRTCPVLERDLPMLGHCDCGRSQRRRYCQVGQEEACRSAFDSGAQLAAWPDRSFLGRL